MSFLLSNVQHELKTEKLKQLPLFLKKHQTFTLPQLFPLQDLIPLFFP
jgi:hypothetical protein